MTEYWIERRLQYAPFEWEVYYHLLGFESDAEVIRAEEKIGWEDRKLYKREGGIKYEYNPITKLFSRYGGKAHQLELEFTCSAANGGA